MMEVKKNMFNNLFELNDNGTYGPKLDGPTELDIREMQKSLFELYEKNAFMYQKMGYIEKNESLLKKMLWKCELWDFVAVEIQQ